MKGPMRTRRSGRIHAQLWGISVLIRRVEAVSVVVPEVIDLAKEIDACGFRRGDMFPDLGNLAEER